MGNIDVTVRGYRYPVEVHCARIEVHGKFGTDYALDEIREPGHIIEVMINGERYSSEFYRNPVVKYVVTDDANRVAFAILHVTMYAGTTDERTPVFIRVQHSADDTANVMQFYVYDDGKLSFDQINAALMAAC